MLKRECKRERAKKKELSVLYFCVDVCVCVVPVFVCLYLCLQSAAVLRGIVKGWGGVRESTCAIGLVSGSHSTAVKHCTALHCLLPLSLSPSHCLLFVLVSPATLRGHVSWPGLTAPSFLHLYLFP